MSKPSEAQIEANRRNAKHSRGPKTESGKHRSSQNAMRHGLAGRVVVLPEEDLEVFKAFCKEIVESLNADAPMERQCAQTIADSQWRLNRARTFEDGMIAMGHFEEAGKFTAENPSIHAALTAAKVFRDRSKDFVNLALYEQRIGKAQKEAFRQLYDLQDRRKAVIPLPQEPTVKATIEQAEPPVQIASAAATASITKNGQDCALAAQQPGRSSTTNGQDLSPQMLDCKPNALTIGFVCSTVEIIPSVPATRNLKSTETPLLNPELMAA
jgi:hypothetical protein